MSKESTFASARADALAAELGSGEGVHARVGFHVTNGTPRYPVHVTHDAPQEGERRPAYTVNA